MVEITAAGFDFVEPRVKVSAGEPFQILFHNQDTGGAHNVALYPMQDGVPLFAYEFFESEVFEGPGDRVYTVDPIEPGKHRFYCNVHKTMWGELIAR